MVEEKNIDEQFKDFMNFLESLLRNNSTVLQSRSLRNALTEGQGNPPGKVGSAKSRDLPKKPLENKQLNHQNNKFGGPKKPAKVPQSSKKSGKENKVCLFCNSNSHNQFARCPEILSRLTDQPSLLKEERATPLAGSPSLETQFLPSSTRPTPSTVAEWERELRDL